MLKLVDGKTGGEFVNLDGNSPGESTLNSPQNLVLDLTDIGNQQNLERMMAPGALAATLKPSQVRT